MKKNIQDVAFEVIFGKWGNNEKRKTKLTKAGYDYYKVQARVNDILTIKTTDIVAQEVINGKWGSGKIRKQRLEKVGYRYEIIQNRVNEIIEKAKPRTTKMCEWAKQIADSKAYHYKKWESKDKKTQQCPICNNLTGEYKGWNCIGFAFAAWKHGGDLPSKCDCGVISNDTAEKILKAHTDNEALSIAQKYINLVSLKVIRNNNGIPAHQLKPGDIIMYFNGNTYFHTALYVGNGKIADSDRGSNPNIKYGRDYVPNKCKVAIRYIG